jgi:hypothetical protein
MDGWIDEWMGWTGGRDAYRGGWVGGCMDGWTGGWAGWVDGMGWDDAACGSVGLHPMMINHSGRKECPSRGATPEAQGEDWNGVHAGAGVALGTWEECLGPSRGSSCQYRACSRETNTRHTFGRDLRMVRLVGGAITKVVAQWKEEVKGAHQGVPYYIALWKGKGKGAHRWVALWNGRREECPPRGAALEQKGKGRQSVLRYVGSHALRAVMSAD